MYHDQVRKLVGAKFIVSLLYNFSCINVSNCLVYQSVYGMPTTCGLNGLSNQRFALTGKRPFGDDKS